MNGVIDAAEATCNPCALSFALLAYGFAYRDADPLPPLEALRRGLVIAQDGGSRANESYLAVSLARLEAEHGDPRAALEYSTLAIRRYHDSGNTTQVRAALAVLTAFFDRLGSYQPAAAIAGFAFSPLTAAWTPEIGAAVHHLPGILARWRRGALPGGR